MFENNTIDCFNYKNNTRLESSYIILYHALLVVNGMVIMLLYLKSLHLSRVLLWVNLDVKISLLDPGIVVLYP